MSYSIAQHRPRIEFPFKSGGHDVRCGETYRGCVNECVGKRNCTGVQGKDIASDERDHIAQGKGSESWSLFGYMNECAVDRRLEIFNEREDISSIGDGARLRDNVLFKVEYQYQTWRIPGC